MRGRVAAGAGQLPSVPGLAARGRQAGRRRRRRRERGCLIVHSQSPSPPPCAEEKGRTVLWLVLVLYSTVRTSVRSRNTSRPFQDRHVADDAMTPCRYRPASRKGERCHCPLLGRHFRFQLQRRQEEKVEAGGSMQTARSGRRARTDGWIWGAHLRRARAAPGLGQCADPRLPVRSRRLG
ncbi:hypothetical protein BS78_03G324800 [Paspalum vaginatum]|nr:hypothetical protein BS78_03G324800 [Paspalum vaginatum]